MNLKIHNRIILYILGLIILAFGITLNTKTELGVSPIISTSYSVSEIANIDFGNATFVLYVILVIAEIIIHLILKEKKTIILDMAQIILSLVFTRILNIFGALIPALKTEMGDMWQGSFAGRLFFLAIAIICTGIGAALSLNMRLIPNPGDGIVQAIADLTQKPTGLIKNFVDIGCVGFTCVISLVFAGKIVGIGIGTLLAMIFVGRVIAVFNHITKTGN